MEANGLPMLDFHVLLALSAGPLHGYAIKTAVASDSGGTQTARAGSFYRVLARLMTNGFVRESAAPAKAEPHPGLERRYYALTPLGRKTLAAEAQQLKRAAAVAEKRLGVLGGRS
jgi:DNA-binding PadR family transcriptional regulator